MARSLSQKADSFIVAVYSGSCPAMGKSIRRKTFAINLGGWQGLTGLYAEKMSQALREKRKLWLFPEVKWRLHVRLIFRLVHKTLDKAGEIDRE
jgi:hypothetical protein